MANPLKTLSYENYRDRVFAGWIGKSIGGVLGARFENHKEFKTLAVEELWPDELVPNDDLDLQVLWLEALQERGLYLTSGDLAEFWQDRCWYFFCEYGIFLNNIQRGIASPLSGTWNNRYFQSSEGCPIRAEIWGYIAAGNPALAAELAQTDGQLDHGIVSVQAEQFLAAAAQAVTGGTLAEALSAGLSVLPPDCAIARLLPRIQDIANRYPEPHKAWRVVIREFGNRNANDAITNHALFLLALFLGKQDFVRTMQLCVHFGWDTDCTASTAGALLGTILGTESLPAEWTARLGKTLICGIHVKHRDGTLADFAEDTCRIGVEMAHSRNPAVVFENAPAVIVRNPPEPGIRLSVEYPAEPVLWSSRLTQIIVKAHNPLAEPRHATISIEPQPGLEIEVCPVTLNIPAQGVAETVVTIHRRDQTPWIADKNLLRAIWSEPGKATAGHIFGLGGARQWLVYGPYWDMWDKTKSEICPYNQPGNVCGPFGVNLTGDCYNQYARLDAAYLDETHLLAGELPDEIPLMVERGEDDFRSEDFGGFQGQACYYLTRTFRSAVGGMDAVISIGRSGPYRAWLDGVEIGSSEEIRSWTILDDENLKIRLTGNPQRLVIKLIRLTDSFDFSLFFKKGGGFDRTRGESNLLDCLEDLTPAQEFACG